MERSKVDIEAETIEIDNEKIYSYKMLNNVNIEFPKKIYLPPHSKISLYDDIDLNGNVCTYENKNDDPIIILPLKENREKNIIKSLSSDMSEGFGQKDVVDICMYTCSNINYRNIIILFTLSILIYYLFRKLI